MGRGALASRMPLLCGGRLSAVFVRLDEFVLLHLGQPRISPFCCGLPGSKWNEFE